MVAAVVQKSVLSSFLWLLGELWEALCDIFRDASYDNLRMKTLATLYHMRSRVGDTGIKDAVVNVVHRIRGEVPQASTPGEVTVLLGTAIDHVEVELTTPTRVNKVMLSDIYDMVERFDPLKAMILDYDNLVGG